MSSEMGAVSVHPRKPFERGELSFTEAKKSTSYNTALVTFTYFLKCHTIPFIFPNAFRVDISGEIVELLPV